MISRRVRGFTESVIREMIRVCQQHEAHPERGRTKIRFCFPETDDMRVEAGRRRAKLVR